MGVWLDLVGLIVRDMGASLRFYRHLGFDIPKESGLEGHVEVMLPGGLRFAWDTLEVIHSFDPQFELHPGPAGAFLCDSPADVEGVQRTGGGRLPGSQTSLGCFLGPALCPGERPRRRDRGRFRTAIGIEFAPGKQNGV